MVADNTGLIDFNKHNFEANTDIFQSNLSLKNNNNVSNSRVYKDFKNLLIEQTINNEDLTQNDNEYDSWVPFINDFIEEGKLEEAVESLQIDSEQFLEDNDILSKNPVFFKQINQCFEKLYNLQDDIDGLKLAENLQSLDEYLNSEIKNLLAIKEKNYKLSTNDNKLKACSSYIENLLGILELFNNCNEFINNSKNFIAALNTLKTLEIYLNKSLTTTNKFDFMRLFKDRIVFIKEKIKTEIFLQLKESLNPKLDKKFERYGLMYQDLYHNGYLKNWKLFLSKNLIFKKMNVTQDAMNLKFNSDMEKLMRVNFLEDPHLESIQRDLLSLDKWYNLIPFFDALQVFKLFDEYDTTNSLTETQQIIGGTTELDQLLLECQKIFKAFKQELIKPLILDDSITEETSKKDINRNTLNKKSFFNDINDFNIYIQKLIGLIQFETFIEKKTDHVFKDSLNIYGFWKQFLGTFVDEVFLYITNNELNNSEFYTQINDNLAILIVAFKENNLYYSDLLDLQLENFKLYTLKEFTTFDVSFKNLLNDDDFMPLNLDEKKLFSKILKLCWFKDEDMEAFENQNLIENGAINTSNNDEFLVCLPFSPLYPMTCSLLRKIESNMVKFIDFYNFENLTLDFKKQVVQGIDKIFMDSVINSFEQKLTTTSREALSQIYINLEYFHLATLEMSTKLVRTLRLNKNFQLKSCDKMNDLRDSIENKLIHLIDSKVQDLIEMIEIDWTSEKVSNEPNLIISDIAQFLEMMFTSTLINLPPQIRTLLIFREFDIITDRFLKIFIHDTPNRITPQAVLNFETDINCLQSVIDALFNGVIFKNDDITSRESLTSTFDEINQYIKLIKTGKIDENFANMRMKIYPRIQPELALKLMKKLSTYQNMLKEKEEERIRQLELENELTSGDKKDTLSLYATQSKKLFGLGKKKDDSSKLGDDSRSLFSSKNKKKLASVFQRKGL
ncbi:uncharacterized protein HGUI_03897 [Hanseniaspora guilliermondii]|uniref:Exocyst complex component SEC15 n=1 Tax=Hanseniaspora guilliermondii TaxID=56406 RepID=A0A1L0B564_9ASCO|nr:uncharacterized protein HGUI_03897 [Hanseniaspora guilliermondii]